MTKESLLGHIEAQPDKRFGKPCKGTRIAVSDVLEMLTEGMSQSDILEEHPNLTPEHIQAALFYAADQLSGAA